MNPIPAPYRILAIVLLLIAGVAFGYVEGIARESDRRDAQALRATVKSIEHADAINTKREQVAAQREVSREQIRIVYKTLKEQAHEIPVDTGCGLNADGLHLWNAANAGTAATLRSQPDGGLPTPAAGEVGTTGRAAGQPHRGNGVVQPMPGPDDQAAGVP